jgi:hypothetical protein
VEARKGAWLLIITPFGDQQSVINSPASGAVKILLFLREVTPVLKTPKE